MANTDHETNPHRIRNGVVGLAVIALGLVAAGCGDDDEASPSTDGDEPAATAEAAVPDTDGADFTEVPATDSPVTEPPATEPPATEPPATEPAATEPPATDSPVTEPPATDPPATDTTAPAASDDGAACVELERLYVAYKVAQAPGDELLAPDLAEVRSTYLLSSARAAADANDDPTLDLTDLVELSERLDALLSANDYDLAAVPESEELDALTQLSIDVETVGLPALGEAIPPRCGTDAADLEALAEDVVVLIRDRGGDPATVPMPSES